jgi:hypothetical protein
MFAMGLIAGIFGILAALLAMLIGGIGGAFNAAGAGGIVGLAVAALLFSIFGIIGASISKSKPKLAGTFMLISGVAGFVCISLFYIISGILFIVAGFIGIFTKRKNRNEKLAPGEYVVRPEGKQL